MRKFEIIYKNTGQINIYTNKNSQMTQSCVATFQVGA